MRFLDRIFNLLWLNIIVVVCCIPVFTAGAAFTAMHYVILRMIHNEEGYVLPNFKKSFKQNFKQATKMWLPMLFFGGVCGVDAYLFSKGAISMPTPYKLAIYILGMIVAMGFLFCFPVLAHYDNTTKGILKNAYAMAVYGNARSLLMLIIVAAPWVAAAFVPNFIFICLFFGFTVPALLCAYIYEGIFKNFEKAEEKAKEENKAQQQ